MGTNSVLVVGSNSEWGHFLVHLPEISNTNWKLTYDGKSFDDAGKNLNIRCGFRQGRYALCSLGYNFELKMLTLIKIETILYKRI